MKFTFSGGANEVGASCTLIEIQGRHILVDAGIRMNVKQDKQLPDLDKVGMPDAFLLTHAHTDHTGALPALVSRLPVSVKGYCTPATKAITRELLKDSKKRADREKREGEDPQFPPEEIDAALGYLERMKEVGWGEPVQICDDVTATWIPAGHILGAAMILIESKLEGKQESILITGDVSVTDQKTIPGLLMSDLPERVDVMVMESTYGNNRQHKKRAKEEKRLVSDVKRVTQAGGKVLIPAFAIGRSQEVILILKHAMQRGEIPKVWVDGMVRDINGVYSDYSGELSLPLQRKAERCADLFYSDAIRKVSSQDERDRILAGPPCCIVAPSGMLIGGRSSDYAKHLAPHSGNLIAITGYQAEGTPGVALLDLTTAEGFAEGVWKLDDGTSVLAECRVKCYSLSAHAGKEQLIELVEKVQPRKLFLVHGDADAREKLAASVCRRDLEVEVKLPKNGSTHTVKKWSGIAEGRQLPHDRILAEVFAFVRKMGLKGPFSIQELTEMWFSTKATTPIAVDFFRLCLWLDSQFFERRSPNLFYLRQPT